MKKRLLSVLLAICLVLAMAPMAMAEDSESEGPIIREEVAEEEVLAYLAQEPATYAANTLEKSSDGKYHITSVQDFDSITSAQWLGENTFVIDENLDLSNSTKTPSEWGGYIQYFRGTLEGANEDITISGMDNNTYLIYGLNGGTIKNLTLKFEGEAAGLAAASAAYKTPIGVTIENVDTEGVVYLTADDQSNYSPYAYCAPQGGMTMKNCTNNANIIGNIYGGIFYGYYPLNRGAGDDIVFDGCVNKGNVTMRNASMFFGNPSVDNVLASADDGFTITIENCVNEGTIRGTVSAHYFVSSLSENLASGGISEKIEAALLGDTTGSIAPHSVSKNTLSESNLLVGAQLEGFAVSVNDDKCITITAPNDTTGIVKYRVAVSSYVSYYDESTKETGGTDRYSVTEDVSASDPNLTVSIKYYGVADDNFGTDGNGIWLPNFDFIPTRSNDGKEYYSIEKLDENHLVDGRFQIYAHAVDGQEITPSCAEPAFLTVTALGENDAVIGITSYGGM